MKKKLIKNFNSYLKAIVFFYLPFANNEKNPASFLDIRPHVFDCSRVGTSTTHSDLFSLRLNINNSLKSQISNLYFNTVKIHQVFCYI